MADTTISQLNNLTAESALLLPVSNGSSTGKVTIANINSLAPVQSVAGKTGSVTLTKSDVGLSNVENKSSATIRGELTSSNIIATASPAIAKAWVNFNGTGTVAIRNDYNVSSITDNGVGDYTINFTTAMSNSNYVAVHGGEAQTSNGRGQTFSSTRTASSIRTTVENWAVGWGGNRLDTSILDVAIFQ